MTNPIIEKLRKLQALADRAGTEAEAANAAARVRELLEKHNLDVGAAELREEEGVEESVRVGTRRPHHIVLSDACCELFDVKSFMSGLRVSGARRRLWDEVFVGLRGNVEAATLTFSYLIASVEALLKGWKAEKPTQEGFLFACNPVNVRDYDAFRRGASARIYQMAISQKQSARYSTELVHIGNAVALRMMEAQKFTGSYAPDLKVRKKQRDAFSDGYEQGARVDLHGARSSRMIGEG